MLDDGGRILDARQGGDVVQRRVVGKRSRGRTRKERLVSRAERHGGARILSRRFRDVRVGYTWV